MIASEQSRRARIIGYPSHFEVDTDCLAFVVGEAERSAMAEAGDPIARYMSALTLLRRGCAAAETALSALLSAGRFHDQRANSARRRQRTTLLPEALYVAAAVQKFCLKDNEASDRLRTESASAGYHWALPPTY